MAEILTVTLNPTLDISTEVASIRPGPKLRCAQPRYHAGGGGVNVARAIAKLGGEATALLVVGGHTGQECLDLLRADGVPTLGIDGPAPTRHGFAVIELESGSQFRFGMPGPEWSAGDCRRFLDSFAAALRPGMFVVVSGSLPPGVEPGLLDQMNRRAVAEGARFVLDTSGPALEAAARFGGPPVEILRMDGEEAEHLAGRAFSTPQALADYGAALVAGGVARHIVSSLAQRHGTVGVSAEDRFFVEPPVIRAVSAIGAGDSLVGAMVMTMARGETFRAAAHLGAAAAGAAVMTPGTALCDPETTRNLHARTSVAAL